MLGEQQRTRRRAGERKTKLRGGAATFAVVAAQPQCVTASVPMHAFALVPCSMRPLRPVELVCSPAQVFCSCELHAVFQPKPPVCVSVTLTCVRRVVRAYAYRKAPGRSRGCIDTTFTSVARPLESYVARATWLGRNSLRTAAETSTQSPTQPRSLLRASEARPYHHNITCARKSKPHRRCR